MIVRAAATGKPWDDRLFDLRVDDHPEPLAELKRLVAIQRAYNHMNGGDAAIERGDFEAANRECTVAGTRILSRSPFGRIPIYAGARPL